MQLALTSGKPGIEEWSVSLRNFNFCQGNRFFLTQFMLQNQNVTVLFPINHHFMGTQFAPFK